ncbi:MAG TPA: GAF domain-containing protein [Anaerolineales bacterium]|nr:GAF domain-containing protein [Anaerolineales bacterium]
MKYPFSLDRYLQRLGGWYIILVIIIAQLSAIVGAILGSASIQSNADFDSKTLAEISRYTPLLILLILASNLGLLALVWYLTPNARKRLTDWTRSQLSANLQEELAAWHEITALTMRYGVAAVFITYAVSILPLVAYYYQAGVITFDQLIYILLGGLVSVLAAVMAGVLIIDRLLTPARLALVPRSFDTQLQGLSGARLTYKFLVLNLILIVIGILLLGPVGFHYMNMGLPADNQSLRQAFQFEAITVSLLTLALGTILAYFISRTVSVPLRDLIGSFKAVEAGDLSQRAAIIATDEIAEVIMHFNRMVASLEELQGNLEKQVQERTRLLKATNDIAKVSSSILDPEELLARVINLFTEQFNYYYAAIYLLDSSEKWAELKEATGEAGKVLKQNRHRLELSGKSMVATCMRERMPRIAQNTSEEKQRVENPLLPYTRSEIALPIMAGDRVLGALNVQSTKAADFGTQVIETMQNMAGQVAIALENAHLFQEARQRIKEMRAIQQQYLLEGWSALSFNKEELEYGVGESNEANSQKIVAPIHLRDQIIGQIDLEGTGDWSTDQKNLIDAVAAQAAIALENARLVNESRQIAVRERMLAEINSRIWSSSTVEAVLQTAIRELGRRLDASSATIELHPNETKQ